MNNDPGAGHARPPKAASLAIASKRVIVTIILTAFGSVQALANTMAMPPDSGNLTVTADGIAALIDVELEEDSVRGSPGETVVWRGRITNGTPEILTHFDFLTDFLTTEADFQLNALLGYEPFELTPGSATAVLPLFSAQLPTHGRNFDATAFVSTVYGQTSGPISISAEAVPEPSTMALFGCALLLLGVRRLRFSAIRRIVAVLLVLAPAVLGQTAQLSTAEPGLALADNRYTVHAPLQNTGVSQASSVRINAVTLGTASGAEPSLPMEVGDLGPGVSKVLRATFEQSGLPAGSRQLLTIRGTFNASGTTLGFAVNRWVTLPERPDDFAQVALHSNHSDPVLLSTQKRDGEYAQFVGDKNNFGAAIALRSGAIRTANGGVTLYDFDDAGRVSRLVTPNGLIYSIAWDSPTFIRVTVRSPDDNVQETVGINLETEPAPVIAPVLNLAAIAGTGNTSEVSVSRCGVPVNGAFVSMRMRDVGGSATRVLYNPELVRDGVYQFQIPIPDPEAAMRFDTKCQAVTKTIGYGCTALRAFGPAGPVLTCGAIAAALATTGAGSILIPKVTAACAGSFTLLAGYCATLGRSAGPGSPSLASTICSRVTEVIDAGIKSPIELSATVISRGVFESEWRSSPPGGPFPGFRVDLPCEVAPVHTRVTGDGSGIISSVPAGISCPDRCTAEFPIGSTVKFEATPASGSIFVGWSCGTNGTVTVSSQGAECLGEFRRGSSALTVEIRGRGAGIVTSVPPQLNCTGTCSGDFANGSTVRLFAQPYPGSMLVGIRGDCGSDGSILIDGPKRCQVEFDVLEYSLTVGLQPTFGGGAVASSDGKLNCTAGTCTARYPAGTPVNLNAFAQAGYRFGGWSLDCSGQSNPFQIVMTSNKQCSARFDPIPTLRILVMPFSVPAQRPGSQIIFTVTVTDGFQSVRDARVKVFDNFNVCGSGSPTLTTDFIGMATFSCNVPQFIQSGAYTISFGPATKDGYNQSGSESRQIFVSR